MSMVSNFSGSASAHSYSVATGDVEVVKLCLKVLDYGIALSVVTKPKDESNRAKTKEFFLNTERENTEVVELFGVVAGANARDVFNKQLVGPSGLRERARRCIVDESCDAPSGWDDPQSQKFLKDMKEACEADYRGKV